MKTEFTLEQLRDAGTARANEILRNCIHCGFCTATCPTYQILGDELDSPRGRIYLIKDMLENQSTPSSQTVTHIDRCLSCLACMTTCPSGVHYMHLVDHARHYIETNYQRRWDDRALRWLLAQILPYPWRFRLALFGAMMARPFARLLPAKLRVMIDFAPRQLPARSPNDAPQVFAAKGPRRKRVALMTGCAQQVLNTDINDATIRLLTRHGCEVVVTKGAGCCGALTHHMGKTGQSHTSAAKNIRAWVGEIDGEGLDAIVINTSGCGTTVKDYGHMFRGEELAGDAARVAGLARDISEVMTDLGLSNAGHGEPINGHGERIRNIEPLIQKNRQPIRVAYHAACSLQHGQQIRTHPKTLLKKAGFAVVEPGEAHLCCGSAGTYNLMQPVISEQLKHRKIRHLEATDPQVIATGNIGCMMQIGSATDLPVVHTVEMLDWATGGPVPRALRGQDFARVSGQSPERQPELAGNTSSLQR